MLHDASEFGGKETDVSGCRGDYHSPSALLKFVSEGTELVCSYIMYN